MKRLGLFFLLVLMTGPALALDSVTLQLKWRHQFQFAGYYMAQEKGYYRDAGLDVRIKEIEPGMDVVSEVVAGRAQFGIGMSDLLLEHQQQPVVPLAVIFQHSPLILLGRADRINSLHDLAGQIVMIEPQAAEINAYLRREGIREDQIQIIPHGGSLRELIDKKVAAVSAYASAEPYVLQQSGIRTVKFSPRASGIDFYGDNLFTSTSELGRNPDRTRAFVQASLQGWEYALSHPEEAIQLILTRYNTQKLSHDALQYEAAETAQLMRADLVQIGHMNPGRWRHIADTYAELGLLPRNYSLAGFLPDTRQTILPPWVTPTFIGGALLLCLLGWLVYRRHVLSQRLGVEIAGHQATIAKLKESETKYRMLAENSNDVIWLMDLATLRFTYISPSVYRLRGMTAEEIMARPMEEALTPESWEKIQALMTENRGRLAAGDLAARHAVVEVDQPCKDGSIKQTEVVTSYIFDDAGKPVTLIGVSRDISARKAIEQKQREFHEQLEAQLAEIQQLQTRLQEQVIRDPLTGLYNRRYLDETLPRELARAKREGYPLSLIMVDLDHFKRINDTYGHAAGDEVLRALAIILRGNAREGDIACRYGGEEFIVALPRLPLEAARDRAEHWCQVLAGTNIRHGELDIRITLSAGVAAFPQQGADMDTLLKNADEALYQAKNNGRNRVTICASHDPT